MPTPSFPRWIELTIVILLVQAASLWKLHHHAVLHHRDSEIVVQKAAKEQAPHAPLSVFYNLYIPPERVDEAVRIAQEQVDQIYKSKVHQTRGVRLNYITIGHKIDDLDCGKNLTCHRLQHVDQGMERITLQVMLDHCQAHPEDTVAYIHSKGTFHPTPKNHRLRQQLTRGALDCWDQMNNDSSSCNLCGQRFVLQWTFMVPGNMMMASCDYVRHLLPPAEYQTKMADAAGHALYLSLWGQLNTRRFGYREDLFGLDRYSDEHWIGSHPDVRPCDLSQAPISWGGPGARDPTDPLTLDVDERKRDYFLLPGQILKWMRLYGQVPSNSSWIWSHYPDGEGWKNAVVKYGNQVVESVTDSYRVSLPPLFADSEVTALPPPPKVYSERIVFFYDAVLNQTDQDQIEKETQRISTVTNATIVVQTFGNETLSFSLCPTCIRGAHFTHDYAGETFRHMHQLCKATSSLVVGYLQSRTIATTNLSRVLECALKLPNDDFNFCASDNSLEPSMWATTCQYLQQLPEPTYFVDTLWPGVLRQALPLHMLGRLTGMNRETSYVHSMQPWISCHPSIVPPPDVKVPPVAARPRQRKMHFQRLAGYLLRWKVLFDDVPSRKSSVWKAFPDGDFFWNETYVVSNDKQNSSN